MKIDANYMIEQEVYRRYRTSNTNDDTTTAFMRHAFEDGATWIIEMIENGVPNSEARELMNDLKEIDHALAEDGYPSESVIRKPIKRAIVYLLKQSLKR